VVPIPVAARPHIAVPDVGAARSFAMRPLLL
jgi:hypothetical protein